MTHLGITEGEAAGDRDGRIASALALLNSYEAVAAELEGELAELKNRLAASIEIEDIMSIEFNYRHYVNLLRRKKLLLLLQENTEKENADE